MWYDSTKAIEECQWTDDQAKDIYNDGSIYRRGPQRTQHERCLLNQVSVHIMGVEFDENEINLYLLHLETVVVLLPFPNDDQFPYGYKTCVILFERNIF